MYSIDCTEFYKGNYSDIWKIAIDISQLRNFTALDNNDAIVIHKNYDLDLDTCKSLIKQSNTSFKLVNEGERVSIMLSVSAFKLGRILAQNSDCIQLENDAPPEAADDIANGMLYELEREQPKPNIIAYSHFKFKMDLNVNNVKPTETSVKNIVYIN